MLQDSNKMSYVSQMRGEIQVDAIESTESEKKNKKV